jgi:hypothetical protein
MPRSLTGVFSMNEGARPPAAGNSLLECWHGPVVAGDARRDRDCSPLVREMCPPCPLCGVHLLPG